MFRQIELKSSISVPSTINAYSIGVEYIKNWFLNKFNKNYFKHVHIDERHVRDEYCDRKSINELLKKEKPTVAIFPQLQFDYDRENIDLYTSGIKNYTMRFDIKKSSFLADTDKNMYIGIHLEQMLINFNIRMKVSTRAQQIDLYNYIKLACRVGGTQDNDIDMDFHIPYSLMLQVARDANFEIKNENIIDKIGFLKYLNSHSVVPILYKIRAINGKGEYFLRLSNMYTHISILDQLTVDDGELEGQLKTNYTIDMNLQLRLPQPKMYVYYSLTDHDKILQSEDVDKGLMNGMYTVLTLTDIKDKNEKGWNKYTITDWVEDDTSKPLKIEFRELFDNSDLYHVIERIKSMYISPNIFIEFKLYNDAEEISFSIDWNTYTIETNDIVKNKTTNLVLYVDLEYLNDQIIQMKSLYTDRLR